MGGLWDYRRSANHDVSLCDVTQTTASKISAVSIPLPLRSLSLFSHMNSSVENSSWPYFAAVRWRYYQCVGLYPFLIILGLLGNGFALITIHRRRLARKNSTYMCLAALAVADSFVLVVSAGRYWLKFSFQLDLQIAGGLMACRTLLFLEYCSADLAVWIIMLVNLQRCFIIFRPLEAAIICSHSRTRLAIMICVLACVLKNLAIPPYATIRPMPSGPLCSLLVDQRFWVLFSWADFLFRVGLPYPCLLFLNVVMYRRVAADPTHSPGETPDMCQSVLAIPPPQTSIQLVSGRRQGRRLLPILIAINVAFLTCYSPYALFMAADGAMHFFVRNAADPELKGRYFGFALIFQTCLTLVYVSHCINFLLYLVYGRHFRRELTNMMRSDGGKSHLNPSIEHQGTLQRSNANPKREEIRNL